MRNVLKHILRHFPCKHFFVFSQLCNTLHLKTIWEFICFCLTVLEGVFDFEVIQLFLCNVIDAFTNTLLNSQNLE